MKKIFVIEQFVYPEGWNGAEYPRKIAIFLAKKGFETTIICSKKPNIKENIYNEDDPRIHGVKIIHINVPFKSKNTLRKLFNQIYFCIVTFRKIIFIKKIDLFLIFTNPPQLILINQLIFFLRKIPFVVNAMDLYPDALINHMKNKTISELIGKFLNIFYNHAYKNSLHVICRGENMLKKLKLKGIHEKKLTIIDNWATGETTKSNKLNFRKRWSIVAKKVIIYSGNLGLTHDYLSILKAIKISNLKENELQVIFMAQGKRISEAKSFVKANKLENIVLFRDLVSNEDLPKALSISDMALVTIKEGFSGIIYPSKFQGYISRSIPIIYIGPHSDISRIVRYENIGASFKNNNINAIANYLIKLANEKLDTFALGVNARNFYLKNMSEEIILEKYFSTIKKLI